jgi:hypothetical protein
MEHVLIEPEFHRSKEGSALAGSIEPTLKTWKSKWHGWRGSIIDASHSEEERSSHYLTGSGTGLGNELSNESAAIRKHESQRLEQKAEKTVD